MTREAPTVRDKIADGQEVGYKLLKEVPEIEAISSEWDSLLERSSCNRAFSSSTWFLATCYFSSQVSPYVFTAWRGGVLVGVLPLIAIEENQGLGFPKNLSDYQDLIAASDDFSIPAGLLNYAISTGKNQRRLVLGRIRSDSNIAQGLKGLDRRLRFNLSFPTQYFYIDLSIGYDGYLVTRSQKFRKNLKRVRRIAGANNVFARELTPEIFPPEQIPGDFLSLHFSRFGNKSCFQREVNSSFIHLALPKLFTERKVRVFALFEGEKKIGIDLYMVGANSFCAWNGGFLPEAERWSPGRLLTEAAISAAYEMKIEELDLLNGTQSWKAQWANKVRDIGQLEFILGE